MSSSPRVDTRQSRQSRRLSQSYSSQSLSSLRPGTRTGVIRPASSGGRRQSFVQGSYYAGVKFADNDNGMAGIGTWASIPQGQAADIQQELARRRAHSESPVPSPEEQSPFDEPQSAPAAATVYRLSSYSTTSLSSPRESPSRQPMKLRKSPPSPSKPIVPQAPQVIYFYNREDPHYGFTNFSPHEVWYDGKRYPTSEHLFQSMKVN